MNNPNKQSSPLLWLAYFIRPYSLALLGTFLALCLAAGTVLFLGKGLQVLINKGFVNSNPEFLNKALITLLGLALILALASFARSYLSSWLGERVVADIKQKIFHHLLLLTPEFYQNNSTGSLQSRLHNDTTLIQVLLGGSASTGLRSIIQFTGAVILLFMSNLKLAALSCLIIPLLILPITVFGRRVRQEARLAQDAEGKTAGFSNECLAAMQTIQAYNQEDLIYQKFKDLTRTTLSLAYKRILSQSCLSTGVIFLVFAAVSILLWYGGNEVFSKHITAGELLAFIFYAVLAAGSINSLSIVYSDWQRAMGACSRLQDILDQRPDACLRAGQQKLAIESPGKICFDNVDFRYPGLNTPVLRSFTLNIRQGEMVALVGPSGAGKSTVFNLLLRFYNPSKGQILVNGTDIQKISSKNLREMIGWVPQEPMIFADNVYNNIRFSKPSATDEEIESAARVAYAIDFINKLPNSFETNLGAEGLSLSSGQKQRLAIARAALKNPAILLLDEATNSLDAESEFQVQKALDQLMKGRTTVLVAHRLSTVLKANRIVVIDHGEIISSGTHTSLVRHCPIYRRFVSLQFDQPENIDEALLTG